MSRAQLVEVGRQRSGTAPPAPLPADLWTAPAVGRQPWWVLGAVLYGLAWPIADGLHLPFLAWVAFVPLLLELERHERFVPFALRVLAFMGLAMLIACWWWFFAVPDRVRALTWIGGAHEILLESAPLLLLFPLKKALGYGRALAGLVLVWPLWEWAYNHWEFSMGYILVAYSQAGAVWLAQYVDLFGVWALTAWVVGFNVLLAQAVRQRGWGRALARRALVVAAVMLAVPLAYAGLRAATLTPVGTLAVTAVYTDFDPVENADGGERIERATHLTDSTAYYASAPPDLYVWPEAAIPYAWTDDSRPFVARAVADWQRPLLTGHGGVQAGLEGDSARFNRAVLLAPGADGPEPTYAKRRFVPFHEGLPHARLFGAIPAVAAYRSRERLIAPGPGPTLLDVETRDGETVRVATPICHEQQFPGLWAEWAREGADVFAHLSFESWFGDRAFQSHFLGISQLRAIETRRSVVRVSNGGPTAVIDGLGRVLRRGDGDEGTITAEAAIYRGTTLYARAPWLFPLACAVGLALLLAQRLFGGRRRSEDRP